MGGEYDLFGCGPVDTGIGDGNPVFQLAWIGRDLLVAGLQVAFDHDAGDGIVSVHDLINDVFQDFRLFLVILI